ncbi:MAG: kynureninase [Planctomycetota bacterium]|nr:MAG: kynureninase [Planctomycetota bacterium]
MTTRSAQAAGAIDLIAEEARARALDDADPLSALRGRFALPSGARGEPLAYFTGNSLGPMPLGARADVEEVLDAWAARGVEGYFEGDRPWVTYTDAMRPPLARLIGAEVSEVAVMNTTTVNLHLMMASFYRPAPGRSAIVIEDGAFPSDSYAVRSQARWHGLDPDEAVIRLTPRHGEAALRTEDVEAFLAREGGRVALVMLGGVNYLSGQWVDMARVTRAARDAGACVGWDLAHAVGNVPMRLHEWGPDFAAWCSYKYLNGGPAAVAGAFVHERHHGAAGSALPRLEGWWGHDPTDRFRMPAVFEPAPDASAWQPSNAPVLSSAPLLASLAIFDEVGIDRLRERSVRLTGYLERLVGSLGGRVRVTTPSDPAARGAQLSMVVPGQSRESLGRLRDRGIVCDFREPDVVRAAPAPLFNSFHDCWRLARALDEITRG